MEEQEYDVIIIGSGIGGLTAASFLSRLANKKVLVLERHFKAGGFTHVFKRKNKYLWDVGVHYIGGLEENGMMRRVFDAITASQVKWQKMPSEFEKFVYPGFSFDVPDNEQAYIQRLVDRFPDKKVSIENYFNDIKSCASWFGRHITMKMVPPSLDKVAHLLELIGHGNATMTTAEYMDNNIADPDLKAILLSQWGDYGLPPSKSAFVMHCLVVSHYLSGGWYPVGGSGTIAEAIVPWIKKNGGEVLVDHDVQSIIVEQGKATGVRANYVVGDRVKKKRFKAPVVISNAGARTTYLKLMTDQKKSEIRDELLNMPASTSCVTLYLGLKDDPRSMGFYGENHWIYNSTDHDKNFNNKSALIDGKPGGAFLSFPSLKDPACDHHTAEIIAFCDYEPFQKWADLPWMKRGKDYKDLKDRISTGLLEFIENHYPGFTDMIDYQELSTPLSNEHFTGHFKGAIYGLPVTVERFQTEWLKVDSPIENLLLTGADVSSPGVSGAMMGGVAAAARAMGMTSMIKLFRHLESMANESL